MYVGIIFTAKIKIGNLDFISQKEFSQTWYFKAFIQGSLVHSQNSWNS
jgi:hypothetical protein